MAVLHEEDVPDVVVVLAAALDVMDVLHVEVDVLGGVPEDVLHHVVDVPIHVYQDARVNAKIVAVQRALQHAMVHVNRNVLEHHQVLYN